jgi:hypothetical protein
MKRLLNDAEIVAAKMKRLDRKNQAKQWLMLNRKPN